MDDYIDRQAAIKDVYAIHTVDTEYDAALIGRLDVRYVLEALPSADVEPVKHGRWINDRWENDVNYHTCNACGVEIRVTYFDNYCPNCGATMDGDENADEITE